jgi:hypothetical protein
MLRFHFCLVLALATSRAADTDATDIMARVAVNQDRALELRKSFVYRQHVVVSTRHFNGKLGRQEKTDYLVAPGAKTSQRKLTAIEGEYQNKGQAIYFHGEPVPAEDSLDGDLVKSFREDLLNEKTRDGVGEDLFPLTTEEQKQYRFDVLEKKPVEGRDTYIIGFAPADSHDFRWTGEAWIDAAEFQPVRVFTKLSRKLPLAVRTLLGTDLPGLGFNVQYKRVEKDVWFPVSFGSEFRLRAIFFIKRDIAMSMTASAFQRSQVDSKIDYESLK